MNEIKSKIHTRHSWPSWPFFTSDEIAIVSNILQSGKVNYWTGNQNQHFEQEYAKSVGTQYAIALMNGTVALEAALYALGIGSGDEVITTARTFIASASAVVIRGGIPVCADVDPVSQNITAKTIEPLINSRTKAIIAVHLAGWPCDMDGINTLANKYGLSIIEDCAQAHGASYKGQSVGSLSDVAAFSFCQDKIITTGGEGGMITTNRKDIWEKIWSFKDHGKSYSAVYQQNHPPGFRFVHETFGTNWRMTEIQAALGRLQLQNLSQSIQLRHRNANILNQKLAHIPLIRLTIPPEEIQHAYYKYYVFVRNEFFKSGWTRNRLLQAIQAAGVPCFTGSCSEIYQEKAFIRANLQPTERLTTAKALGETSLMFLVHPTLSEKDMHEMGEIIVNVIKEASFSH